MAVKKNKKTKKTGEPMKHTVDSLTKAVKEITTNRKMELEDDPEVSKAICDLADYVGELFLELLDKSIQSDSEANKRKNMLLVLQLTYLKLSSEMIGTNSKVELTSDIPTSGYTGAKAIASDQAPMYY